MWFKNLRVFRFLQPCGWTAEALHNQLATLSFQPCGRMDMQSMGWVSPLGLDDSPLTHGNAACVLIAARRQEKILPAAVLREYVQEKVKDIEQREQRKVRQRERKSLQEELLQELIPRAFTRSTETYGYIDTKNGWLCIDTGNQKRAQEFTALLRKTLGSLPVVLPQLQQSPALVMTNWLTEQEYPADFSLAEACQLVDSGADGATVSCKNQDLMAEEVHAHLAAGKQVTKLALQWEERMSFTLDDELTVKGLQFLDVEQDSNSSDPIEQFDNDFALMHLQVAELLQRLFAVFGGEDQAAYDKMQQFMEGDAVLEAVSKG